MKIDKEKLMAFYGMLQTDRNLNAIIKNVMCLLDLSEKQIKKETIAIKKFIEARIK